MSTMRSGRWRAPAAIVLFVGLSVPLCLAWPHVSAALAARVDEPAGWLLLRTSPDVVWSDHTLEGAREIVLENNTRRRVAPILAKATSLAPPIFVSLILAALVVPRARRRLGGRTGAARVARALGALALTELLVAGLAIGYALAVENGRSPGALHRFVTVTANALRAFVPFVLAAWVIVPLRARDQRSLTMRVRGPAPPRAPA